MSIGLVWTSEVVTECHEYPLGGPTARFVLSEAGRETLERWTRRPSTVQAPALRTRIVVGVVPGQTIVEITSALGCHPATARNWGCRYTPQHLDGLSDEPCPGAPRTISDAQVEAVIVSTLKEQPRRGMHWLTNSMAGELGRSQSAVCRIMRAFRLKPPWVEQFRLLPGLAVHRQGVLFAFELDHLVGLSVGHLEAVVVSPDGGC